jgi:hypothetical protein
VAEADHRADDERRRIEPALLPAVHRPTRPEGAGAGKLPICVPQKRGFFSPFEKDTRAAAMNIATALTLGDMTMLC